MGSRGDHSNGPDWRDVAAAMADLERAHAGQVILALRRLGTGKKPELEVLAMLADEAAFNLGLPPLVCSRSSIRIGDAGDLDAALLSAVYSLDFAASDLPKESRWAP